MTFVTPCARPENDSDDWFIGRDGKQYADDPVLTDDQITEIRAGILANASSYTDPAEAADLAVQAAEQRERKRSLIRRRKAREKCHTECILRLQCLGENLELPYGTAGGYYEEERAQIVSLRNERESRREVGAQE